MKDMSELSLADQLLIKQIGEVREKKLSSTFGGAMQRVLEFRQNMPILGPLLKQFDDAVVGGMKRGVSQAFPNSEIALDARRELRARELQKEGYIPEDWHI